jgi:hypothetical protein
MVKRKLKRRRIPFGRSLIWTTAPADWIIGKEADGRWTFLCRGSIVEYDPSKPRFFNVERMTRDQARERMEMLREFGTGILLEMRPMLFKEFRRSIGIGARYFEIAGLEDAIQADNREIEQNRQEKCREAMRSLFSKQGR